LPGRKRDLSANQLIQRGEENSAAHRQGSRVTQPFPIEGLLHPVTPWTYVQLRKWENQLGHDFFGWWTALRGLAV